MPNEQIVKSKAPYTQAQIDLITKTVAKGASQDELKLFLMVANRTKLDPFSNQIHFVKRGEVGTIQTGIDGFRAIAERSGKLAGIDDAVFDTEDAEHPEKATVTVYKIVNNERVAFTASARWKEYAVSFNGKLSHMWQKMPYLMLGKCAEALALRKAFPNDLSGIYAHEEMQQADTQNTDNAVVVESAVIKPSVKQMEFIESLMFDKGYTASDLIDVGFDINDLTGGRDGTASKLIEYLTLAKSKIGPNGKVKFDNVPELDENGLIKTEEKVPFP